MQDAAGFHIKCLAFFLLTLAGASFLWLGCGKKGPPRAPRQPLPATVKDLSYRIDDDSVKLSWTVPVADNPGAAYPAGVKLYRFKQPADESSCEKCPIRFSEIADLPVSGNAAGKSGSIPMSFTAVLERGYRYIYKVIVYNRDGIRGKDSNTIEFLF
jgi:hypothetical protein